MAIVVYKYIVGLDHGTHDVVMKRGANIIDVGFQTSPFGVLQLVTWAVCDPAETQQETRRFVALYTGETQDFGDTEFTYVGTAQHVFPNLQLPFVCHVFESEIRNKGEKDV